MSLALYRKYRPITFDEIVGQVHVSAPLAVSVDNKKIHHAYLFSGPRGCGKTSSARILARSINCASGPTSKPCDECESCVELASGGSLDVVEIDAASHGGIDDAREIRDRVTFLPARDRYKVFIIDEAHMVTGAAFNALLKVVEEPPEGVVFVFATTEPHKVIPTIRSRTHHYPFRLVSFEDMINYVRKICEKEKIEADEQTLNLIVRAGEGSVRDCLSVLDQLISGSSKQCIDFDSAVALLGYTPNAILDSVAQAILNRDINALFATLATVFESGHNALRFAQDLLQVFSDLLIVLAVSTNVRSILSSYTNDRFDHLCKLAQETSFEEVSFIADTLQKSIDNMNPQVDYKIYLEIALAKIMAHIGTKQVNR